MGAGGSDEPVSPGAFSDASGMAGAGQTTEPDLFDFLIPSSTPPAPRPDHVPIGLHDFRPPSVPSDSTTVSPEKLPASALIPHDWYPVQAPLQPAVADHGIEQRRVHERAVLASFEGSIKALLKRFEPGELEQRMSKTSVFFNLPGIGEAQRWRQFVELSEQISKEAAQEVSRLFSEEITRLYEARPDLSFRP
jgi:hypothetical protein